MTESAESQLSLFGHSPPGDDREALQGTREAAEPSSYDLGRSHQARLQNSGRRKATGAFYTPPDVVEGLLATAFDPLLEQCLTAEDVERIRVLDPSCGSGNFLEAAGERIERRLTDLGVHQRDAARIAYLECVVGVDIDPDAAEICRAVLASRSGTSPPAMEPQVFVLDSLSVPLRAQVSLFTDVRDRPSSWEEVQSRVGAHAGFDLVIGNPPFLNQLESETAVGAAGMARLRERFGDAVGAYTDVAALFLLLAAELVSRDGGRVCLIEPISVLSARHVRQVRCSLLRQLKLEAIWIAGEKIFDAAVDVCALLLVVPDRPGSEPSTTIIESRKFRTVITRRSPFVDDRSWSYLLASQRQLPHRHFSTHGELSSIAVATADFRDQYYGLADHVNDQVDGDPSTDPKLITAGLIDPADCLWGHRSTKFNKRSYLHPRVNVPSLTPALQEWAHRRLTPKLLMATQTRVLEVIVDPEGHLLPSVPVVTITARPDDLWRIGAMLSSPPITLIAAERHLGAALSADALKLSASDVLALPLPTDADEWERAAAHFRSACVAPSAEIRHHLLLSARAMCAAYGIPGDDELVTWWSERLRKV